MSIKTFTSTLYEQFFKNETTTFAASLAFYTVLSLAPILILFVTVSSYFNQDLQARFLTEVQALVGTQGADAVEMIFRSAKDNQEFNTLAGILGLATLLVSASLIFGELRSAFNRIFDIQPKEDPNATIWRVMGDFLRGRLLHIGFVLSFIFALVVSLVASSLISNAVYLDDQSSASFINISLSSMFYVVVFIAMFHYLPSCKPNWRVSVQGGVMTAIMFVIGKELIGIYLGKSAIGSAYGAAGSVVVLLAWVYYSAMVILVGAEISSILFRRWDGGRREAQA